MASPSSKSKGFKSSIDKPAGTLSKTSAQSGQVFESVEQRKEVEAFQAGEQKTSGVIRSDVVAPRVEQLRQQAIGDNRVVQQQDVAQGPPVGVVAQVGGFGLSSQAAAKFGTALSPQGQRGAARTVREQEREQQARVARAGKGITTSILEGSTKTLGAQVLEGVKSSSKFQQKANEANVIGELSKQANTQRQASKAASLGVLGATESLNTLDLIKRREFEQSIRSRQSASDRGLGSAIAPGLPVASTLFGSVTAPSEYLLPIQPEARQEAKSLKVEKIAQQRNERQNKELFETLSKSITTNTTDTGFLNTNLNRGRLLVLSGTEYLVSGKPVGAIFGGLNQLGITKSKSIQEEKTAIKSDINAVSKSYSELKKLGILGTAKATVNILGKQAKSLFIGTAQIAYKSPEAFSGITSIGTGFAEKISPPSKEVIQFKKEIAQRKREALNIPSDTVSVFSLPEARTAILTGGILAGGYFLAGAAPVASKIVFTTVEVGTVGLAVLNPNPENVANVLTVGAFRGYGSLAKPRFKVGDVTVGVANVRAQNIEVPTALQAEQLSSVRVRSQSILGKVTGNYKDFDVLVKGKYKGFSNEDFAFLRGTLEGIPSKGKFGSTVLGIQQVTPTTSVSVQTDVTGQRASLLRRIFTGKGRVDTTQKQVNIIKRSKTAPEIDVNVVGQTPDGKPIIELKETSPSQELTRFLGVTTPSTKAGVLKNAPRIPAKFSVSFIEPPTQLRVKELSTAKIGEAISIEEKSKPILGIKNLKRTKTNVELTRVYSPGEKDILRITKGLVPVEKVPIPTQRFNIEFLKNRIRSKLGKSNILGYISTEFERVRLKSGIIIGNKPVRSISIFKRSDRTIAHEIGHNISFGVTSRDFGGKEKRLVFESELRKEDRDFFKRYLKTYKPSEYVAEYNAEAIGAYLRNPSDFKNKYPETSKNIEDAIQRFNGVGPELRPAKFRQKITKSTYTVPVVRQIGFDGGTRVTNAIIESRAKVNVLSKELKSSFPEVKFDKRGSVLLELPKKTSPNVNVQEGGQGQVLLTQTSQRSKNLRALQELQATLRPSPSQIKRAVVSQLPKSQTSFKTVLPVFSQQPEQRRSFTFSRSATGQESSSKLLSANRFDILSRQVSRQVPKTSLQPLSRFNFVQVPSQKPRQVPEQVPRQAPRQIPQQVPSQIVRQVPEQVPTQILTPFFTTRPPPPPPPAPPDTPFIPPFNFDLDEKPSKRQLGRFRLKGRFTPSLIAITGGKVGKKQKGILSGLAIRGISSKAAKALRKVLD